MLREVFGRVIVWVPFLSLVTFCIWFPILVNVCNGIFNGNWPILNAPPPASLKGLTHDEVRTMLGKPHSRYPSKETPALLIASVSTVGLAGSPLGYGPLIAASGAFQGRTNEGTIWYYGSWGVGIFCVHFGLDGRVENSHWD